MENNTRGKSYLISEDLKILENYIQELWHFLPIPMCLLNPAFNIINASNALGDISSHRVLEIIGENMEDFLRNFQEVKKELSSKESISSKEATLLAKEKKEIPVSLFAKIRRDERGDITGYFFAFIDAREVKEQEKELHEKVKELERFNRLAVGRELKMIDLKEEITRLRKKEK